MFYLLKPLLCKGFPDSFGTSFSRVRVSVETRRARESYAHGYPQIATGPRQGSDTDDCRDDLQPDA